MSEEVVPVPPCPYCGHHTLFRPDGWVAGGPLECANPLCDSNQPEPLVPPLEEYAIQYHNGSAWRFSHISTTGQRHVFTVVDEALAKKNEMASENPTAGVQYRVVGRQVTPWVEVPE